MSNNSQHNGNNPSDGSNRHLKHRTPAENTEDSSNQEQSSEWWNQSQTRRNNLGTMITLGIGTVIIGGVIINEIFEDSDDVEQQSDSLSLQKKEGWNIGSDDKALYFDGKPTETDSKNSKDWFNFLKPANLLKAYQPTNVNFAPFVVPTLVQSLDNSSLVNRMRLNSNPDINKAYSKGLGMREVIKKAKNPEEILYIVDSEGPESVAFGAALADVADLIITFDNWPHPIGVVPSHDTLSELIFFAKEVQEKAALRPKNAPPVFLLDRKRYVEKINPDTQFDNRYMAKLPTAENLKQMNIKSILYFVPDRSVQNELDDLNDDFAAFKSAGIDLQMVPLSDFTKEESNDTTTNHQQPRNEPDMRNGGYYESQPSYYYGGGYSHLGFFFMNYAMMRPSYTIVQSRMPASRISPPRYTPASRPTVFNRTGYSAKSIGKSRPSSFGTVRTSVSKSSGKLSGVRAGGHGSFGRGGSFGG
ncbi:MAG: hypothetical protein NT007_18960 [Candidatus Kapabacteria bacterium]|nr:hypothetical protein [Candidatus Kapabacteria bacterium]